MKINLLLLSDYAPTGMGLTTGQSFLDQFVRRLQQSDHQLQTDLYMATDMSLTINRLQSLPLAHYDLIMVQTANRELSAPERGAWAGRWPWQLGYYLRRPASLLTVTEQLKTMLLLLRPHRRRVVLLTPVPHRGRATGWLRRQGRRLFLNLGAQLGVGVFDTQALIGTDEAFFQADSLSCLSAVSHELLGSRLLDFYRAQSTAQTTDWVNRWIDSGRGV